MLVSVVIVDRSSYATSRSRSSCIFIEIIENRGVKRDFAYVAAIHNTSASLVKSTSVNVN